MNTRRCCVEALAQATLANIHKRMQAECKEGTQCDATMIIPRTHVHESREHRDGK